MAYNVKNTFVKNLGLVLPDSDITVTILVIRYDPMYLSKEKILEVFAGFTLRKNFSMKEQLDWIIIHLHAGGFWQKWNRDMFDEKV